MRTDLRYRVAVAGAEIRMLVLATVPDGSIGVDLASGAFVRAVHAAPADEVLSPLDVVGACLGAPLNPPDCARPEAVQLTAPPQRVGRLASRRAEHYLHALEHPPQGPLLGFSGLAAPYWTLEGDHPSLTVLNVEVGPQVRWTATGFECRFSWQGALHQYPLGDERLVRTLRRMETPRCGGRDLVRVVGFKPRRVLLVLAPPVDGYCVKQVAALLPGGRSAHRA